MWLSEFLLFSPFGIILICQLMLIQFSSMTTESAAVEAATGDSNHQYSINYNFPVAVDNVVLDDKGKVKKREPDPFECKFHSLCKRPNGSYTNSDEREAVKEDDDKKRKKNLEEAKRIAKKSANKLLKILQKFGEAFNGSNSSSQMGAEEFVTLMASVVSPVTQLFGGPFGTVFTGVRESLVPSIDPVLKAIAELNTELDRQFDADADRLDEMIRQLKRHQSIMCYNGQVTCVIDLLQPYYNSLTTPANIDDPKEYDKTVHNFLSVCKNDSIAYGVLNNFLFLASSYEYILTPVFHDKREEPDERENLLSAAKLIQIHAIKLASMATLCAEFRNNGDGNDQHDLTEDMNIILNGISAWIQILLEKDPPSPPSPPPDDYDDDNSSSNSVSAIKHTNILRSSDSQHQLAILIFVYSLFALASYRMV